MTHVKLQIVLIAAKDQKHVNHVLVDLCLIKAIKIVLNAVLICITVKNAQDWLIINKHALNATKISPFLARDQKR